MEIVTHVLTSPQPELRSRSNAARRQAARENIGIDVAEGDIASKSEMQGLLNGKEDVSNKVTAWGETPADSQYPSAALVHSEITRLETLIGNLGGFEKATLTTGANPVPDVQDPKHTIIYLTLISTAPEPDKYKEWIYNDQDQWEVIGDTTIDLTDYYDKTAVDRLLAGKVDTVSGKGLSTNDYTDADKTKLDGITWPSSDVPVDNNWRTLNKKKSGSGTETEWKLSVYGTGAGSNNSYTIDTASQGQGRVIKEGTFSSASNGMVCGKKNGDLTMVTVREVPSATASDSGKVLTVNQDGGTEWGQHEWVAGTHVVPKKPITGLVIGGRTYRTVTIGNQEWMAENLDWQFDGLVVGAEGTSASEKRANYYNNDETTYGVYGNKYGLLYNWKAVDYLEQHKETMLPSGWHVPTKSEFETLIEFVGGKNVAGTKLKSVTGWSTGPGDGTTGFDAYPAGMYDGGWTEGSSHWTATAYNDTIAYRVGMGSASSAYIYEEMMYTESSIRLVRDIT